MCDLFAAVAVAKFVFNVHANIFIIGISCSIDVSDVILCVVLCHQLH